MAYGINNKRIDRPHGLVSLSEHVENYSSKISNKINECRLSSSVCLVLLCKLRWYVQFPCCQHEKPMLKISCFALHVGVVFILWISRVTEFSKVGKSSAESKIMRVLSQGKFKYNITGRNLSGVCDFNNDFLHMEGTGKFVQNVSVVNGWKVWLFVEGAPTSDILICDYFVS